MLKSDSPLRALPCLCQSLGLKEHHATASLIGTAFDLLGEYAQAAESYRRAVALAYGDPFGRPVQSRDFVGYYAWLESSAWASAGQWDWAFDASNRWLPALEEGRLKCEFDDVDYLEKVRAVHMIASLHHLRGEEAWERAASVATAILADRSDTQEARLAEVILATKGNAFNSLQIEFDDYLRRN